jgi:hypothetical protein
MLFDLQVTLLLATEWEMPVRSVSRSGVVNLYGVIGYMIRLQIESLMLTSVSICFLLVRAAMSTSSVFF